MKAEHESLSTALNDWVHVFATTRVRLSVTPTYQSQLTDYEHSEIPIRAIEYRRKSHEHPTQSNERLW
jgi:hypothetical protein